MSKKDKEKECTTIWEEFFQDKFKVQFNQLKNLSHSELVTALQKYEELSLKQKNDLKVYKDKFNQLAQERNQIFDECEEYQQQLIQMQRLFNEELQKQQELNANNNNIQINSQSAHCLQQFLDNLIEISKKENFEQKINQHLTLLNKSIQEYNSSNVEIVQLKDQIGQEQIYRRQILSLNEELQCEIMKLTKKNNEKLQEANPKSQMRQIEKQNEEYSQKILELQKKAEENKNIIEDFNIQKQLLYEDLLKQKGLITEINQKHEIALNQLKQENKNVENLHENCTKNEENFYIQRKELENKIIQERLKNEQKRKEFVKIEEKYKEILGERNQLLENIEKDKQNISYLQNKRKIEKLKLKEYKERIQNLNKSIVDCQNQNLTDVQIKDKQITSLEEHITFLQKTLNVEKDILIANLQLEVENKNAVIEQKEGVITRLEESISQKEALMHQQNQNIFELEGRREKAISEMTFLTEQIEILKETPKQTKITKKNEFQTQFEKGVSKEIKIAPNKEIKPLQIIKKELEIAYKEYVQIAFNINQKGSIDESIKNLVNFEKKLNKINEKTQDLIDSVEEEQVQNTKNN